VAFPRSQPMCSSRLLKFGFSQLYPAFETGSVVLVECH
jgi:hypothetical protein